MTFGVVPTHAETGYGYIRQGVGEGAVRPVAEFVEKPDASAREAFVASGDYFWNSGMFLLPAQGYLDELGRLDPAMLRPAARHSSRPPATWISCDSTRPRSRPAGPIRSTTR